MPPPNTVLGICFKLLNLALFTTMSLLWAGSGLPTSIEMFVVCVMAAFMLALAMTLTPGAHFKTLHLWGYLGRALTGILAMWTWIEAIKIIAPTLATAFSYATPFFCFFIGKWFFKEKLPPLVFMAFGLSILGALLALVPHMDAPLVLKGVLLSVASASCWALYNSFCKYQAAARENFFAQAFYTFAFSALLIAPIALLQGAHLPTGAALSGGTFLKMAEISLCRVLNIIALFFAYRYAGLSLLASFEFVRIIFMAFGSYLLWQTIPTPLDCLGAGLIFLASGLIVREGKKKPE